MRKGPATIPLERHGDCAATPPNLTRRDVAKWLALSCGVSPLLAGCGQRLSTGAAPRVGGRRLARVQVSPERVIRQVVGLRPFRRSGFLVKAESFGDKTLIHNYGHGGGGVSLSWGTAELALDLALETNARQAAVLGCGAVGLAAARLLQDHGFSVTIYTRDLPPNTTSNIAGAQWNPVTVADDDRRTPAFVAQYERATRFAHRYFQNLVGPRYGITWREDFRLSETAGGSRSWEGGVLAELRKRVSVEPDQHPFGRLYVSRTLTMHIEPATYLAAVLADFRLAGGRVVIREFGDLPSIAAVPDPLVVNCTGLGARALFGDPDLLPIKGQLTVLVPQPEVDYITVGPGDLYMMPRQDGIILGGTHERDVWSLEPNPVESERILRGHRDLFESMG